MMDWILAHGPIILTVATGSVAILQLDHNLRGNNSLIGTMGAGSWNLLLKIAIPLVYFAVKADLETVRGLGREVGRRPGCRPPTPDDAREVHDYLTSMKGAGEDVSKELIREAWEAVLCR